MPEQSVLSYNRWCEMGRAGVYADFLDKYLKTMFTYALKPSGVGVD